jgi:F-type H+-transporting ATPase subunit b
MEEIVHAFGIDWRLIVIQMFNFALLLGALGYFLYTPILKMLDERAAKLKQGVIDAEQAAKSREDADAEKGSILKGARVEAETIVATAKSYAEVKGSELVRDAEDAATRILEDAKARGEKERDQARKSSEAEIAQAAILAAESILRKQ